MVSKTAPGTAAFRFWGFEGEGGVRCERQTMTIARLLDAPPGPRQPHDLARGRLRHCSITRRRSSPPSLGQGRLRCMCSGLRGASLARRSQPAGHARPRKKSHDVPAGGSTDLESRLVCTNTRLIQAQRSPVPCMPNLTHRASCATSPHAKHPQAKRRRIDSREVSGFGHTPVAVPALRRRRR